jgi:hypothetical protein
MNRFLKYPLLAEAGEENQPAGGDTFTREQVEAMIAEAVGKEVAGLKANNEALLSEKKEAARQAKEAAEAKLRAEQERARQSGELETFEKTLRSQYDQQLAASNERYGKLADRVLGSERKAVVGSISGILIDESAADVIGMMVKTEFDEAGEVLTKFVDASGNLITTDVEQFKKYLGDHKAFSHLVKADAATGGGAGGNKQGGGAANFANMTATERAILANKDPALYERLSAKS